MQKTITAYFSFFFRPSILLWILFNTASCASFFQEKSPWEGTYFYDTQWGKSFVDPEDDFGGTERTMIIIEQKDSLLWVSIDADRDPPGRFLLIDTPVQTVTDSLLTFVFEDNWGTPGRGKFYKNNNGTAQLELEISEGEAYSPVSYLYGSRSLLWHGVLAADKHNERAESFYREGRLDDAINLTKMLLVCYPYQRYALVNMGLYYFKKGDWDTAEKWCRKLLTSTSENGYRAQAYYNLSLIYEKKKQPEIAQRYLFISYYLRPHPIVEKALLKKDATLTLPHKIPSAHPYESLETHPLQQKLYTPAFAELSAEVVIRSLFPAVEPELLKERLFVHQHYELISEVNYIFWKADPTIV